MTEYRIVRDTYNGYEVQSRRWWWPFWVQGRTNSHQTIAQAEYYAKQLAENKNAVKYLGTMKETPND